MQSLAKTVDQYLAELTEDKKPILSKLRKSCVTILKDYEETMEYGMPCYKKNNVGEVAFASQKNYISLYITKHAVVIKNLSLLDKKSVGKSCIRFSNPKKIDFTVVEKLLHDTFASSDTVCPR